MEQTPPDELISVEVAYALPERQAIIELQVEAGTTALEAAQRSGITDPFEGIDLDNAKLGIFGAARVKGRKAAEKEG